jgi:hypothetical protein
MLARMNALVRRSPGDSLEETLVDERVRELFARLPFLLGFSLDQGLWVVDVVVGTWPGGQWKDRVKGEVGAALATLLAEAESEGVEERLRGRTFARTLH